MLTSLVSAVSGSVKDHEGRPVEECTVILFAADERRWTDRSRFLLIARPAQDGPFRVPAVPPEDYLAVALPAVNGSEWLDPAFLATLRDRATRVSVAEGEAKHIELVLRQRP